MYSELISNLPRTEDRNSWTDQELATVWTLEDMISEYSYGEKSIDNDFWYLSMFTDISGRYSLTSTDYTVYPGDC